MKPGWAHAAGIGEYHGPRSQMMRCIDFPTMVRDGVGWGAPSGVSAAYLACEGFTGAPALTCDSERAQPHWTDLGNQWRTIEHTPITSPMRVAAGPILPSMRCAI